MPKENNQTIEETETTGTPAKPRSFPWLMLCVAVFFDLIGLIPIINIITEVLASLILGLWQWIYAPKTNPAITLLVAKMIDAMSLGFLPSNIAIVLYAYLKQKAAAKIMAVAPVQT
jgi:hypothetical protein